MKQTKRENRRRMLGFMAMTGGMALCALTVATGHATAQAPPAEDVTVVQISAGQSHTLVLGADGRVRTWSDRQVNRENAPNSVPNLPVVVEDLTDVVAIAAGRDHNLALKGDGTVWGWGNNQNLKLGQPSEINYATPVRIQPLSRIVAIAAGSSHSVAVKGMGQ